MSRWCFSGKQRPDPVNLASGLQRRPSASNHAWHFPIKKCIVCQEDQDVASQNAALLRNGLSLKGREKPNRMFIFYKVKKKKSQPPRLRIDINFMGLWVVR